MKKISRKNLSKLLSMGVMAVFFFSQNMMAGLSYADAGKAATKVNHKPVKYFVPEKRMMLTASVKDEKGIELVRCYFRAEGEADFVFVPMTQTSDGTYSAVLPAPSAATPAIEYVFLVVNSEKQIVKTQTFTVPKQEGSDTPEWQQAGSEGDIAVKTELEKPPQQLAGFSDSITIDQVESSMRFGMVAGGLYAVTSSAAAGATAATAAGTITASAGISTMTIVAVGAAVVAGGVAVGASGGGGGGGSSASGGSLSYSDGIITNSGNERVTVDDIAITYGGLASYASSVSSAFSNYGYDVSTSGDDLIISWDVDQTLAAGEYIDLSAMQSVVDEYAGEYGTSLTIDIGTSDGTYSFTSQ